MIQTKTDGTTSNHNYSLPLNFTPEGRATHFNKYCDKDLNVFVDVFGIYLISHNSIPEEYILHSANILAEFIDNCSRIFLLSTNVTTATPPTSTRNNFWNCSRKLCFEIENG